MTNISNPRLEDWELLTEGDKWTTLVDYAKGKAVHLRGKASGFPGVADGTYIVTRSVIRWDKLNKTVVVAGLAESCDPVKVKLGYRSRRQTKWNLLQEGHSEQEAEDVLNDRYGTRKQERWHVHVRCRDSTCSETFTFEGKKPTYKGLVSESPYGFLIKNTFFHFDSVLKIKITRI